MQLHSHGIPCGGIHVNPLTKQKALSIMSADPYIEIMQNA